MSSFYDDASLVMIPSCYKVSTVLCEKPTDGSGDLTFTRTGDTATRVNSSGLVEKVRTNLTLYSEQFDNASWTKGTLTVTINAGAAPNGTTTADLIYPSANSSNSVIFNGITIANSTEYTNSIYVKASGKTWTYIRGINDGAGVWFDVANGVVGAMNIGVSGTIASVGSGWYRCSVTQTSSSTTGRLVVLVVDGNGSTAVTASGTNGLLIWGAQQETGVATAYIPTTTAAVSVGPVANLPRLDYLGSTCGKLLLEPQRVNLATFSEQFANTTAWGKTRLTVTENIAVSPDGYTNADRITDTTFTANSSFIDRQISSTIGTTYTFSAFLKAGTAPYMYVGIYDGANFHAILNAATGAITFTTAGATSSVTAYGNGWYRISITRTITASVSVYPYIGVCQLSNSIIYNGTGTYTAFVYGGQYEAGSFATSYIPTLAASATRSVDDAAKTGITALIGQTEGTLFLDFEGGANDSVNHFMGFSDGTTANRIVIVRSSANTLYGQIRVGGVEQALIQTVTLTSNTRYKCAFAYKGNDVVFYVNGAQVGTDNSATIPATSVFATNTGVGSSYFERAINQTLIFKTRLTNAQLAELTTL